VSGNVSTCYFIEFVILSLRCIVIKSKEILNINDSFDIQVSLIVLVVLVAAINSDSAADNLPQMRQVTFLFTND
jgi:hypothetical protein